MTRDYGRELYPFLYPARPASAAGLASVLASARESTRQKCRDIVELRRAVAAGSLDELVAASRAMAESFRAGGRLLAFGNGGSATDAQDAASDCVLPPRTGWRRLPALTLTAEVAVLTAVANDVGYDHVFSRQLAAYGREGDIALAFSTSGASRSVLLALNEARRRGMLTVALTGSGGGAITTTGAANFCFVVPHDYIPRIQEAHATMWHTLLSLVQAWLQRDAEPAP